MGWKTNNTQVSLMREDWERERALRLHNQDRARSVVSLHSERNGWELWERDEVMGALGIMVDQRDSPALGHEDKRRARRGGRLAEEVISVGEKTVSSQDPNACRCMGGTGANCESCNKSASSGK